MLADPRKRLEPSRGFKVHDANARVELAEIRSVRIAISNSTPAPWAANPLQSSEQTFSEPPPVRDAMYSRMSGDSLGRSTSVRFSEVRIPVGSKQCKGEELIP